jgi:phosphinothricin acetyltransferase
MDVTINEMKAEDWDAVKAIYEEGIATGQATFESTVPAWEEWDANHLQLCRLAARKGDRIAGWAALSAVSSRCAYGGVAEVSVYVAEEARGQGIGTRLLRALVQVSEREGFWTLQAGIFPENEASIHVHEKCGFRTVGRRERLGQMHGVWRDVVLMERRSTITGV